MPSREMRIRSVGTDYVMITEAEDKGGVFTEHDLATIHLRQIQHSLGGQDSVVLRNRRRNSVVKKIQLSIIPASSNFSYHQRNVC